ncbi:MAG: phosphatidylserine decarboxylase family protein [Proteobacteria bacterium]|nr:phosphatidylserine decarboxylase family protein [Pseudomonadota bacterium]
MVKKKRENQIIAVEGIKIAIITLFFALFFFLYKIYTVSAILLIFFIFNLFFFRNPKRIAPEGNQIVSPADGEVILIKDVYEEKFLKKEVTKISIFMSIFNVHLNRAPYDGEVIKIQYEKGRFFSADLDKATDENEKNYILINTPEGREILFVQVAGLIARRIICDIKKGDYIKKGDIVGLICYGSRLDVFLPKNSEIRVKLKDRVKAGESILGILKNE